LDFFYKPFYKVAKSGRAARTKKGESMKTLAIALVAFLPLNSLAAHLLTTAKVSGVVADRIMELGTEGWNAGESAAGHIYMNLSNITCVKTVTDQDAEISCTASTNDPEGIGTQTVSSKDGTDTARALRAALIEVTKGKAEKKTSTTTRTLHANSILCEGLSSGHDLDDIDLETQRTCKIVY